MAYATVTQMRDYLPQVKVSSEQETLLEAILARSTSMIDGALGFSFLGYDAVATLRTVLADGTNYLTLPPHESGSVTIVGYGGTTYTDYAQRVVHGRGTLYRAYGWWRDYVDVTAKWGYGLPPASIVEVCLELAVNIWRSKDRGMFTDVIGVEGSGAVFIPSRMFTATQQDVVARVKAQYVDVAI